VQRAGIRDVLEVRIALEAEAARLAAVRHEPADLERMRAALDAQAQLEGEGGRPADGNLELHADHDVAFHRAVVEAAHNTALTATYGWFSSSVREALVTALDDHAIPKIVHGDHHAVMEAIASGDPEAAERAARALLDKPRRAVETLLDGR
jgi:DNA-binding FadR family transcriptional regulator